MKVRTAAVLLIWLVCCTGSWTQEHTYSKQGTETESRQQAPESHNSQEAQNESQDNKEDHSRHSSQMSDHQMAGMDHGDMAHSPQTFIEQIEHHATSGTSAEPNSTPTPMLMSMKGDWMFMLHGVAFLNVLQQSGTRGSDKVFSTNWLMPMAQRQLGPGTFTIRAMLSLEPGTVTHRYYPELFQQGETAFGRPIVDGQHPHDLFMELAALYDVRLGEHNLLSFYFAPMGDPAIGPTAYPHRASAFENPMAVLGHHLEDSTHISSDVITAGFTHKNVRVEVSGFHGEEPDEYRWNIDQGKLDSWSTRLTVQPGANWSVQYSFAHLTSPEALHPDEDLERMTASVMYNRPIANGNWASTIAWGRNHGTAHDTVWNGYLAESTLRFAERNYVWGRFENVDRTSELLLRNRREPDDFEESVIGRVQAYTLGYERDIDLIPKLLTGIGAQMTFYSTPDRLKADYGDHPVGALLFLRVRPFDKHR